MYADYAAVGFLAGEFSAAGTSPTLRTAFTDADQERPAGCPATVALDVQEGRSRQALVKEVHEFASLLHAGCTGFLDNHEQMAIDYHAAMHDLYGDMDAELHAFYADVDWGPDVDRFSDS